MLGLEVFKPQFTTFSILPQIYATFCKNARFWCILWCTKPPGGRGVELVLGEGECNIHHATSDSLPLDPVNCFLIAIQYYNRFA